MTFKDLKKRVSVETQQQQSRLFDTLQNKPFWIWNIDQHKLEDIKINGNCCFNHIIALPQKEGNDKPLYDYQQIIFNSLVTQSNNKHLWIKKATGLGISEFMLRFMAWLPCNINFRVIHQWSEVWSVDCIVAQYSNFVLE